MYNCKYIECLAWVVELLTALYFPNGLNQRGSAHGDRYYVKSAVAISYTHHILANLI